MKATCTGAIVARKPILPILLIAAAASVQSSAAQDSRAQPALAPSTRHNFVCSGPPAPLHARCHAHVIADSRAHPFVTSSLIYGYGPLQFQTAYGVAGLKPGTPQTIAIVDAYDDPRIEADLASYSATFGLPPCTTANGCFKKVNQYGGTSYPVPDQAWALEISLDVEIAHAMCPTCKILLVEANSSSFVDLLAAEDYATAHATVVSNSWGAPEFAGQTYFDAHFNRWHVPIAVSSGDNGYEVEYPAASVFVTAVGGTTLALNADNTRASETAWSGAGSGCSAYEPKPRWQADRGCWRRTVADVAADANPATGAAIYDSYGYLNHSGWFQIGGTSLAAALIASLYAIAGNSTSTIYGLYPYQHPASLFDVLSGSNGSCTGSYLCLSGPGYDGPTGLGAPKGIGAF